MLVLDTDPRSPERGQYGFVQALIQRVAYETLSRRDRKAKHLAAARYLSESAGIDPDEIAEVIATHLLDAYRSEPDDADADAIKADARDWLTRAAERAAALAATDDAQRAFESAVELADDPLQRARLLERAGEVARMANRLDAAERHLRAAFALCDEAGASHDRARVAAALGMAVWQQGRIDEAIELMEGAFACSRPTSRTRTWRRSRRSSGASTSSPRTRSRRPSGSRPRSTSGSGWCCRQFSLGAQHEEPAAPASPHEADALLRRRFGSRSTTTSSSRPCAPTTTCCR